MALDVASSDVAGHAPGDTGTRVAGPGSGPPLRRPTTRPTANEALKIERSGMRPPSRWLPRASNPTEAMQPHCVQSGSPPYWHGEIGCLRSADTHAVVREKMHSSGDCGGRR